MLCPDCGLNLEKTNLIGFDDSYRCVGCGGWWVSGWVVNSLAQGDKTITVEPANKHSKTTGDGKCPTDHALLVVPPKEDLPESLRVEKCNTCGWWWFPQDEVFNYAKAMAARETYMRLWKKQDWMKLAWPALVVTILVGGVVGGVVLTKSRQDVSIQANVDIRDLVVVPLGQDWYEVRFRSDLEVVQVAIKEAGTHIYSQYQTQKLDDYYVVRIESVKNTKYEMDVMGKIVEFEVSE